MKTLSYSLKAQRNAEILTYGRQLSLRPSVAHKSKKSYSRKNYRILDYE